MAESELTILEKQVEAGSSLTTVGLLESELRNLWDQFKGARLSSDVEQRMLDGLRMFYGRYDAEEYSRIQQRGGADVYLKLVANKSKDAFAWLVDIFVGKGDSKTWRVLPTPVPDTGTPEDRIRVMEEAVELERVLFDLMLEGGWRDVINKFLFDFVVMPAAFIKGPIIKKKPVRIRTKSGIEYKEKEQLSFEYVNAFDVFPAPGAKSLRDDLIQRSYVNLPDLTFLKAQRGYDSKVLDYLINNYAFLKPGQELLSYERELAMLETKDNSAGATGLVMLEYWLTRPGSWAIKNGVKEFSSGEEIKPDEIYLFNIITITDKIIYVGRSNSPIFEKPYYKCSWFNIPNTFWGLGIPDILKDLQRIMLASGRSLVENMSLSSGFQVIVNDVRRLEGNQITTIYPHKIWLCSNRFNSPLPAIQFQQPTSNAAELLGVIDKLKIFADQELGVPSYLFGDSTTLPPNVSRTSSGLSVLFTQAAKGLRRVVLELDAAVIRPIVERVFDWGVQRDERVKKFKGDVNIVVAGIVEAIARSQYLEQISSLLVQMKDPTDISITGLRGRAALWREILKLTDLDAYDLVRPDRDLVIEEQNMKSMEMQIHQLEQQKAQLELQKTQAEYQLRQLELQLEQQRLQTEAQIAQLKLQAAAEDAQKRAAITYRMAANADAKLYNDLLKDETKQQQVETFAPSNAPNYGVNPEETALGLTGMETQPTLPPIGGTPE